MDVFRAMEKRYGKVNQVRRSPATEREALVQFVNDSDAKFVWAARSIELYDRNCAVELATTRGAAVADPRGRSRDDSPPPMRGGAGAYSNPRMGMGGGSGGFSSRDMASRDSGMVMPLRRQQMSPDRSRGDGWSMYTLDRSIDWLVDWIKNCISTVQRPYSFRLIIELNCIIIMFDESFYSINSFDCAEYIFTLEIRAFFVIFLWLMPFYIHVFDWLIELNWIFPSNVF